MHQPSSSLSSRSARSASDVRLDWRIAIACAATLTVLFSIQNYFSAAATGTTPSILDAVVPQVITWSIWLALLPLIFDIGRSARARGLTRPSTIVVQITASVAVALLHAVCLGVARWGLGIALSDDLGTVLQTVIGRIFAANFLRFWLISAAYHAIAYHREVRERDVNEARLAASLAEAKLESLEGRLHPHFLFNTLNAIAALIRDDPRAAEAMIGNLSDLLRASLNAEPGREVTLERELDLLNRYMAIQQARFHDRLRIKVDAPADVLGAYVPQMILQPLVENAISHGIAPREASGTLSLTAARQGTMLRLVVRDDGVGFGKGPASRKGNGIGISSTQARLAHLYGDQYSFDIGDASPTGTVVTIDLPFHTEGPRRPGGGIVS